MVCAAQFSCCSAELHFFDGYGPSSQEMNSNDYSTRFMESYCIMNMSCMPAVLKKSGSQWPNSCKPAKHSIWKALFSGFRVCPGRAETVDKWGGKTNHQLIAYSLSNISAKNYQNRIICAEVIMSFLRHSVILSLSFFQRCGATKPDEAAASYMLLRSYACIWDWRQITGCGFSFLRNQ